MKKPRILSSLGPLAGLLITASVALVTAPANAQLSLSGSSSVGGPLSVSGLGGLTQINSLVNGDVLTSAQKILYGGRNDPFYEVPATLPSSKPGAIIKSRVVLAPHFPEATVTQVMYVSRDVNDKPVAVTGTVLVPKLDLSGTVNAPVGSVQGPLPTLPVVGELAGANLGFPVGGPKYSSRPA